MPCLTDPAAEARRVAAVRAALAAGRPWLSSTGPRSSAGKRAVSQNALRHGLDTLAVKWAVRYCTGVERALTAALKP